MRLIKRNKLCVTRLLFGAKNEVLRYSIRMEFRVVRRHIPQFSSSFIMESDIILLLLLLFFFTSASTLIISVNCVFFLEKQKKKSKNRKIVCILFLAKQISANLFIIVCVCVRRIINISKKTSFFFSLTLKRNNFSL